ncbi:MAG: hypothetical protein KGN37_17310 [Burkholderiales bacterium]|nr:hypothetical protein [Burkholderiales bacterium]
MSESKYSIETRWGGSEIQPTVQRMQELIGELAVKDGEHPDTWLTHEASGWAIRLDEQRMAYLENPESKIVSHMSEVSPAQALELWSRFATGGREAVAGEAWVKGPVPISEHELQLRQQQAHELTLAMDRKFYDQLGPERQDVHCKAEGCSRGAIQYSVFCRSHHFENIRRRTCPFNH